MFEKIENQILKSVPRGIKLDKLFNKRPDDETLKDFLMKFFTRWNDNRNTIYADTREVQTEMCKRRSLGDIFMICKFYYPECSLQDVLLLLYKEFPKSIDHFRTSMCRQIEKRVWYVHDIKRTIIHNGDEQDEYGNDVEWYLNELDIFDTVRDMDILYHLKENSSEEEDNDEEDDY